MLWHEGRGRRWRHGAGRANGGHEPACHADLDAITAAHTLLAAMIDNHVYWGNALQTDIQRIVWRRVLDMNDRALRQITTSLGGGGDGVPREAGFDITVAFEVMAILCLARNLGVLQQRLGYIIVATRCDKTPLLARDLKADEAMTMLLRDAMQPHVVQTLAFVHGGRFANIAHGCNPVTATATALKLADYVVTEAGFGADLGAEKFMNIKCRKAGLSPACVVVVATCGTTAMLCRHWAEGSAGITDLARRVVELADSGAVAVIPLYPDDMGLAEKFDTVARRIYRADRAVMDARVCMQLVEWEAQGFGDLPVCMVKTPYSSTTDPDVRGAPTVCDVPVREVRLSAGAGFVVAILIGADPASEVYVRS